MSEDIKFSIITIVYNDAVGLERTFKSVQSQTHKNYEHIIIDGASTDGTSAVIEKYRDDKTRVTSEPDKGIYDAMNKGLRLVEGDYFQCLNAGDTYALVDNLENISTLLHAHHADVIYGDSSYFNAEFKTIRYWPALEYSKIRIYTGWLPCHSAVIAKTSLINEHGYFDTDLTIAGDTEMLLRWFLSPATKFLCVKQHLSCMEAGGVSNASLGHILKAWKQVTIAWFRHKMIYAIIAPTLKILRKVFQFSSRNIPEAAKTQKIK